MPTRCWQRKTPVEIPVRRRFVPLKQSMKPNSDDLFSASSSIVAMIPASFESTS